MTSSVTQLLYFASGQKGRSGPERIKAIWSYLHGAIETVRPALNVHKYDRL
jgi:hypothetical protein